MFSFIFCLVAMFPPKFGMKKVKVGNGDVIGRDNIEEFLTFASKLFTHEKDL